MVVPNFSLLKTFLECTLLHVLSQVHVEGFLQCSSQKVKLLGQRGLPILSTNRSCQVVLQSGFSSLYLHEFISPCLSDPGHYWCSFAKLMGKKMVPLLFLMTGKAIPLHVAWLLSFPLHELSVPIICPFFYWFFVVILF